MRCAGDTPHGLRVRALIVLLWRAGLRVSEALALAESDLDCTTGGVLVRRGKGGKRREVGSGTPTIRTPQGTRPRGLVTAGDSLRKRALSVTEQLSDNIGGLLASDLGDSLEAFRVLTLADEDDQRSVGVALVVFDVAGIELRQLGIEIAGL